jgi:hypothetical protein
VGFSFLPGGLNKHFLLFWESYLETISWNDRLTLLCVEMYISRPQVKKGDFLSAQYSTHRITLLTVLKVSTYSPTAGD